MKHLLLATVAFLPMTAMADSFQVPMEPANVIVYPQGAMVQSRLVMDMPAGRHDVSFLIPRSLTYRLIPQIEVAGATVLGTRVGQSTSDDAYAFLTARQRGVVDQHDALKEQVTTAEANLATLMLNQDALRTQAAYLQALRPSIETPQSLEDLQAIVGYLPAALRDNAAARADLATDIRAAEVDVAELNEQLGRSTMALRGLGLPSEDWAQVVLDIDLSDAGEVGILVDAFAENAGWRTQYDIQMDEDAATVTFDRSAAVTQSTGQGWDDVVLTLSSAKPFQRTAASMVRRDEVRVREVSKLSRGASMSDVMMAPEVVAEVVESASTGPVARFDGVAVSFDIASLTDVGTGDLGTVIPLAPVEIDVAVDRFANGRFDKHAYVRARFVNASGQPILSGGSKLFRDGNLIGARQVDLIAAGADATMFFGPDDSLPVTLKFLSEMSGDEGFFTSSSTRQEEIAVEVRNLGDTPQDVVIAYATPVSVEEDVDVDVRVQPTADRIAVEGEPGVMEWDFDLAAGASATIELDFKIAWPDGGDINWSR